MRLLGQLRTETTRLSKVRERRDGMRILLSILCTSLFVCVGCTAPPPPQHPLADLHIPGVSKVPKGERVAQHVITHQIGAITTYIASADGHTARILASDGERIFDIGVDGSAFHEVPLAAPCSGELSVTVDGQWGACQSERGIEVFGLSGSSKGQSREVLQNPEGEVLRTPSWAPDGRHLATASRLDGGAVNIYTVSPTYDALHLTARLTFAFAYVDSVSWSADGKWLAVLGGASGMSGFSIHLVHIGPLLPRLLGHEDAPVSIYIGSDQVSAVQGLPPMTWSHPIPSGGDAVNTATMTLTDSDGRRIVQQNLMTGQLMTLLTQQVGYICGLAWTPDNSELVFALCGPNTTEYYGPPTVLYTYTPPT